MACPYCNNPFSTINVYTILHRCSTYEVCQPSEILAHAAIEMKLLVPAIIALPGVSKYSRNLASNGFKTVKDYIKQYDQMEHISELANTLFAIGFHCGDAITTAHAVANLSSELKADREYIHTFVEDAKIEKEKSEAIQNVNPDNEIGIMIMNIDNVNK